MLGSCKTWRVSACLVILLLSFSESVLGAKLGDRGKGWVVKADKEGGWYCHYNGRFTIQGNLGYYGETKTCTPLVVWQGKTAFASVAAQGNTGSQSKNVWIIKSDPKREWWGGLEVLITPSSSKGGYLTPTTAKTYDEWGDPDTSSGVKMQLKKRKHYYRFYAGEGSDETTAPDEVDCLQIDLTTRQKGGDSSIAYDYSNCANQRGRVKFVFSDPDASNWLLTPV